MRKILCCLFCAFLVCGVVAEVCSAQTTGGTLRGTVTDTQGGAVAGAKVTITNTATNVATPLETNSAGIYNYPDLIVGSYSVTVETQGFQKYVRGGIQIFANQVTEVNVELQVGAMTTTVEVTSTAPVIETGTSQITNDFTSVQVTQLPNTDPAGSQLYLALLAPGQTAQQAGVTGEGGSIGGARPRFNSFTIDGVDDNRVDVNGHTQYVIPETVSDFNLLTNQFSAEYGHSAGGQFNTVTKSGTNSVHGGLWAYNNNRDYDAYDNLQKIPVSGVVPPKPRSDFNRFGGEVGGPIIHDKFFVYGAYQQIVQGLASQGTGQFTPTAAGLATLESATDSGAADVFKQFPVATAQFGAKTENVTVNPAFIPGTTCPPPGGCNIPLGLISPLAPNFTNQWDWIVNGDVNLGKHVLAVHVLWDRQRTPNVNATTPQGQFTGSVAEDARKYLFKDSWTISSTFVNQFSASMSRFVQDFEVPATFANFPNAEVDTLGVNVGPQGCSPQSTIINTYQFVDSMSYVRGKHSLKWGIEWAHWISPTDFLPRARGEWDYKSLNELANDQVPTGRNGALRGAGSGRFRGNQNSIYWFAQDDWKVTRRLTLNLGLRYEWNGVPLDDGLQSMNALSDLAGVYTFEKPQSDTNNWAPRVGFAYDPTGSGKWAIRGGFGISYDITPNNFPQLSLPPQLQTEQNPGITCGLAAAPAWCPDFTGGTGTGHGFLQGGGLAQINVPCSTALDCRASTQGYISSVLGPNPRIIEPKVLTWSVGVQHDLGWNSTIEVRYVRTRSLELPIQARTNTQTAFDAGFPSIPEYFAAGSVPATVPTPAVTLANFDTFLNNGGGAPSPPSANGCVNPSPYVNGEQGFCGSLVTAFLARGNGTYNGVSVDFNHRVGHGLTLRADYTYSSNYDNGTNELFTSFVNPRRSQDWRHLGDDWGRSTLDVPSKLAISWVYDIPGNHGDHSIIRGLSNGWQWGGVWLAYNGTPATILNGADANGDGQSTGDRPMRNPLGTTTNFADPSHVQADFVCNDGPGGATRIVAFNNVDANGFANCGSNDDTNIVGYVAHDPTAKYVTAGEGVRSNLGRVGFRTLGVQVWNMNIQKDNRIGERVHLVLGVSAYNVFNHRNFALAQPDVFQAANGSLVNTVNNALSQTYNNLQATGSGFLNPNQFSGGSRILRLAVRLTF